MLYEATRLSQLTVDEWVRIRATLHALDADHFQCDKCLSQRPEVVEKSKKIKRCVDESPTPVHFVGDKKEIKFTRCIGNYFTKTVFDLLELQRLYELGTMPERGGAIDQCAKTLEAFSVIASYKADKMKKELQKQRAKTRAQVGRKTIG